MKILIALDESPISTRAAQEAVRLFSGKDAEFIVISVTPLPVLWAGTGGYGVVAALPMDQAWLEIPQETDEELLARAEAAGIDAAEAETAKGDPVMLICRAAEEHDVDVIVVGSHDKSALRRLFDPSVATAVIRESHRPVLVVSGEPREQAEKADDTR